jgi:tetratricopeptide (TPR) repeat protein
VKDWESDKRRSISALNRQDPRIIILTIRRNQIAAELAGWLTRTYPDDGPLTWLSGVAFRRVGKKDESHEAFVRAASMLAPLLPQAWGGFAAGQVERGEMDFAAANFRIALFLDDSNSHFWGDLAQIELSEEQYVAAYHSFSRAIELGQRSFINYYYRGLAARSLGRDLEGMEDWALALDAEPAHPRAEEIRELVASHAAGDPDQRFRFGDVEAPE